MTDTADGYEHLEIEVSGEVGWLWIDRPEKHNALSEDLWRDLPLAMAALGRDPRVRVVVVAGRGPSFSVGIDLAYLAAVGEEAGEGGSGSDASRNMARYRHVRRLQATMSAFESCPKPVIAAVHGFCLGAGVDLITACDIRVASSDAVFSVRETKVGLVADVGTLQRLPSIIAPGHLAELVYTGRDIEAAEAERIGLVNRVHPDREAMIEAVGELARDIAANSPLVVQGVKSVLAAERGMSTEAALDHVALWNAAFLTSNDLGEGIAAVVERRPPRFTGD
jgi:enoyl-CoA hydratase